MKELYFPKNFQWGVATSAPLTMCWMLYASHIFDKYVNKEHYPQTYRKGMRKIEEEENQSQKKRSLY